MGLQQTPVKIFQSPFQPLDADGNGDFFPLFQEDMSGIPFRPLSFIGTKVEIDGDNPDPLLSRPMRGETGTDRDISSRQPQRNEGNLRNRRAVDRFSEYSPQKCIMNTSPLASTVI